MKKYIQSYPVISFILVTFLYSWTLWFLMILSNRGLLPFRFPTNFLGSFGPAAGALVVTGFISGRKGLKELFRSMARIKAPLPVYLFSLFFIIVVYLVTAGITSFSDEGILNTGKLPAAYELVIYFFVIAIIGGPLGEETGWRGFLQPELMKRFNPVITSLIIAVIWLIWHLPLFWLEGAAQEGSSVLYFAISVIAMSFLFTWLYMRTSGSLFIAILFHTMINYISAYIVPSVLPGSGSSSFFGHISTLLILFASGIFYIFFFKEYTERKNLPVRD